MLIFQRVMCRKRPLVDRCIYHQWSENGSKKGRYLKDEELAGISEQLDRRKAPQEELKAVKAEFAGMTKKKKQESATVASMRAILI